MSECRRKIMYFTPAQPLASRCQQWRRTGDGHGSVWNKSSRSLSNPRVTHSPGCDALKASILARGLDNPPVLTRRPGDAENTCSPAAETAPSSMNCGRRHRMSVTTVSAGRSDHGRALVTAAGRSPILIRPSGRKRLHNGLMFIERAGGSCTCAICTRQVLNAEHSRCWRQLTATAIPSAVTKSAGCHRPSTGCCPASLVLWPYPGYRSPAGTAQRSEQVWVKLMPLERQPEFAD